MSTVSVISSSSCLPSSRIHSRRHGSKLNLRPLHLGTQSLPFPSTDMGKRSFQVTISRDVVTYSGELPLPLSLPDSFPTPPEGSGNLWIVGVLLSVIIPFWKNKWWGLLALKQNVDKVVETVEEVAEIVESVAEEVEKVAEEAAEHLPEGSSLQKAALFVESAARKVADDAEFATEVIDKVEKMENEMMSYLNEDEETKKEDPKTKEKEDPQQKQDQKQKQKQAVTDQTTSS